MFTKLTDFGYRRSPLEAIGFYITYLLGWSVVAALVYAVIEPLLSQVSPADVGRVVSVIGSTMMTALVAWRKDLLSNFRGIVMILLAGTIAVFHGSLAGMITAAYLTTHNADKTEDQVDQVDDDL